MKQKLMTLTLILSALTLTNCGKSNTSSAGASADSSTSGVAAGAVGGALTNSGANGTQARMSYAMPPTLMASIRSSLNPLPTASADSALFCPTFKTSGSGCSASGADMWLTYNACTFSGRAEWNGVQQITMSSGAATCGQFPKPAANQNLYRQYVQAANASTPGQVTVTTDSNQGTIDDSVSNLANFNGDNIASVLPGGGYGAAVSFGAADTRTSLTIAHRLTVSGVLDHSVTGNLTINEDPGATSRTVNGSVTVYHNLLRVIGTSQFNNVTHDDVCCLPVGGSIVTTFAAGSQVLPTRAGERYVGASETLTFTGCGTATLTAVDGSVASVTLNRCF
jgi:hypothetical protein